MEQKERLIELSKLSPVEILNAFRNRYYTDGNSTENGIVANAINDVLPRMTVPPCKVGDTVYVVSRYYTATWEIFECKVDEITIYEKHIFIKLMSKKGNFDFGENISSIGKTVFLNREGAEKVIAERGKE